jgi:ankyrin repeat protein
MREAEMRHILQRDQHVSQQDPDDAPDYEHILEVCEDFNILVNVRGGNCLDVHPPASNYLLRTLDSWCPDAKMRVAKRCLRYLVLTEFKKGPCRTDVEFESRLQNYALYEYTVQYCADHLRDLDHLPMLLVRQFLMDERKVASATQVMSVLHQNPSGPGYSQRFDLPGSGLHLASQLGLISVLTSLVGVKQQWVGMMDSKGRTPLWCAIENGQQETIKFLSRVDRTTFTLLLEKTETKSAKTLLRMAGPDIRDLRSNTALHIGVIRKDLEIMRLSLESGVDIDAKNVDGDSAIQLATKSQQGEAIHLLLKNSASTARLTVDDWLFAFDDVINNPNSSSGIKLVENEFGRINIALFRVNDFQPVNNPILSTTRRLL